jgi:hypothetical protein
LGQKRRWKRARIDVRFTADSQRHKGLSAVRLWAKIRHRTVAMHADRRIKYCWGNRSLPVKWKSHSSAARFLLGRAHGWIIRSRNRALSSRDLWGRAGSGLSGFAFGLVASAIWLYILTPLQTATLIIAFGLIVQGYSVWKLRGALDLKKLWPFVLGAALGVPVGVSILTWANPVHVRMAVGAFLVLYSFYALLRPAIPRVAGGATADAGIGFLNGVLGGRF